MKRELFIHFSFWLSFFIFVALIRHYLAIPYWPFWVGGIIGTILPDIDHVIYFYVVSPSELTSQRFNFLLQKKDILRMVQLLYETRSERRGLIFHTVFFQLIFAVLTFLMVTSSSLLGKGLVLAFFLHLVIDQIMDLTELGSFDNWLKNTPIKLDYRGAKIYWVTSLAALLIFGFLL